MLSKDLIHFQNKKGFTLLEVLLAITVLSILMAYIYSIIDESISTKDNVIAEDREYLQIQSALSRIELDLSQIYSPLYHSAEYSKANASGDSENSDSSNSQYETDNSYDSDLKDKSGFKFEPSKKFPVISVTGQLAPAILNPDKSTFFFMTSSHRRMLAGSKQSNYNWVHYSLEAPSSKPDVNDEVKGENIVRKSSPTDIYSKEFNWSEVKGYPLARNVSSLIFEFWDTEKKKYVDSLKFLSANKRTPRLIRVSLKWVDLNGIEHEESKTIRPLWPSFDTKADEIAKKKESSNKKKDDSNNENGDENNE